MDFSFFLFFLNASTDSQKTPEEGFAAGRNKRLGLLMDSAQGKQCFLLQETQQHD